MLVDMMTAVETGAGELMLVLYVHVVCAAANTSSQIFTVFQEPLTLSVSEVSDNTTVCLKPLVVSNGMCLPSLHVVGENPSG